MRLRSGYEGRKARLEMISLMDVMFLILVFFVYSVFSLSARRGIRVDLPGAPGPRQRGRPVVVTLAADGSLYLDKTALDGETLLRETLARRAASGAPVLIRADRAAGFGIAVELLQKLRGAGVSNVTFQVAGRPPATGATAAR